MQNLNTENQAENTTSAESAARDFTPTPEAVAAYENRIEAKRERFTDRAAKANGESSSVRNRAHAMYEQIPFGQPILVGHHSERRDRNFRNKIHTMQGKAFALMQKAEHYEAKAANVGTGGISSDDPSAIIKLEKELAGLQNNQELMKQANKAIKAAKTPEAQLAALIALGYDEKTAQSLLNPRFGRAGFASYSLTNNNANIKRVQTRIEELKALKSREDVEEVTEGYTYREDVEDNRIHFVFDGKPSENVRVLLKSHAFKWSPSRSAWVRQLNANGLHAARRVKAQLKELA